MSIVLDRAATSTYLAKVHAYIACGDEVAAKQYARLLYRALADAKLLERSQLSAKV